MHTVVIMLLPIIASIIFGVVWSEPDVAIPKLNESEWWGPDELIGNVDTSIRGFQVKFSDALVENLRYYLNNTRYGPSLKGVGFTYGFNTDQLPSWIKYWAEEYPFYERLAFLNSLPQYKTNIQGLDIHFLWVKPNVTNGLKVVPLLMLHGWPGSVREFYETIPYLTSCNTGYNFTFEVIAPSLPGAGFSDATSRPGLAPHLIGVIMKNLMRRLGHEKFYIQGGDWGSIIASNMVTLFPDSIIGQHTNFPFILSYDVLSKIVAGNFFPDAIMEPALQSRLYPLQDTAEIAIENFGYFHLQATRPDSVGVALSDSPAGLLAYILPHFIPYSDKPLMATEDGGLSTIGISRQKLIDNLMIYWTSNCVSSSMRIYAEYSTKKTRNLAIDSYPSKVPTWLLQAKYEIFFEPAKVLKTKYPNLLGSTILEEGGHFFALQHPDIFAKDVFKAVNAFMLFNSNNGYSCTYDD